MYGGGAPFDCVGGTLYGVPAEVYPKKNKKMMSDNRQFTNVLMLFQFSLTLYSICYSSISKNAKNKDYFD